MIQCGVRSGSVVVLRSGLDEDQTSEEFTEEVPILDNDRDSDFENNANGDMDGQLFRLQGPVDVPLDDDETSLHDGKNNTCESTSPEAESEVVEDHPSDSEVNNQREQDEDVQNPDGKTNTLDGAVLPSLTDSDSGQQEVTLEHGSLPPVANTLNTNATATERVDEVHSRSSIFLHHSLSRR